jgi:hypothetical protein
MKLFLNARITDKMPPEVTLKLHPTVQAIQYRKSNRQTVAMWVVVCMGS